MGVNWSAPDGPWKGDGIAIVGMAGRFPRARTIGEFWDNLREGRDCISRLSEDELLAAGVDPGTLANERFVPAGAVLDDIDLFDAAFFGISPREAESMDPQQRFFLEVVQHALDDAGIDPARAPGAIGVFAGARLSGYWLGLMANPEFMGTMGWHQVATGNDKDFLPTQASFRFDLRGPSINVQSACSTSMLALSLGCDALLAGHCDVAIAGAASIAVPHRTGYVYQPSGIASPDGACRPFDASAKGSVLGSGVAAVVLKRVGNAIAARDRIYAVIRGIAVNNDGHRKTSFAAPSVKGQADVIASAMERAGISPGDIDYIEAHGTATALGDPIEVAALARVMDGATRRGPPCGIGSVKSNVGHLDPVAGVASLIKTALCLFHGEIPASIHFERPNPAIDFAGAGLRVVSAREPWPRRDTTRYAGVSAFGIGGTNVHAVLQEAPEVHATAANRSRPQLLVVSAKSPEALRIVGSELADLLRSPEEVTLDDVAFTLACGRPAFPQRRWIVAATRDDAADLLALPDTHEPVRSLRDREVFFLFPGQGGQYLGMGAELYRDQPVVRAALDEVFELAKPELGFDPHELLDPRANANGNGHGNGGAHDVQRTELAQPLLFALEYAAARLWMHWGVRPHGMLGHSVGELVAACVAGVFSLPDAVRIVCARGRLMQSMPPGAMLAVSLDQQEALELEDENVKVAAFNGPRQQTLTGPAEAIDDLVRRLRERRVEHHRLVTSHAFHHPSMAGAAWELQEIIRPMRRNEPGVPFISCVSGDWIRSEQALSAEYWGQSMLAPVRFSDGVRKILESGTGVLIECGAGRSLESLVRSHAPQPDTVMVGTISAQRDPRPDQHTILQALGTVWQAGVTIDWDNFCRTGSGRRTTLPPHPFLPQRFWIDPPSSPHVQSGNPAMRNLASHCYVRTWLPAPLQQPAPLQDEAPREIDGTWLVLVDSSWMGQALVDRLQHAGARVIAIVASARYQRISDFMLCMDPYSAESAEQVIAHAGISDGPIHLVNCWMSSVPAGSLSVDRAATGLVLSLTAPVNLLQALSRAGHHVNTVHTITSRLFGIAQGEVPEPIAAPAIGLTRVLPQEFTGTRARIVDVSSPMSSMEARIIVEQVATEVTSDQSEAVVAYRGGVRMHESFTPVAVPEPLVAADRVRAGGTYLVTGGFGGIGGVLSKLLATVGQVRLVLVGRRGMPESDDQSPEAGSARRLVQELEELGATVLPLAADMSEPAEVTRVVREVEARFGKIHGVIHAAGVAGGGMLAVRTAAAAAAVLAPKVDGTVALLVALAPHQPDFVVLCSSFASLGGGLGQGDYCAANAFLDAAAWYARAQGLRVTSINWPAWREVGMVESMRLPPELEHLREASLSSGITPAEGAELFARILASDLPQVIIPPFAPGGFAAGRAPTSASAPAPEDRRPAAPSRAARPEPRSVPRRPSRPAAPRTDSAVTHAAASAPGEAAPSADDIAGLLVSRLGGIWGAVLGVRAIAPDANFYELGGQSLMVLQVVSRVREQFGVELSLSDMLEHPTLDRFAAFVEKRLVDGIVALPDARVRELLARGEANATLG